MNIISMREGRIGGSSSLTKKTATKVDESDDRITELQVIAISTKWFTILLSSKYNAENE